MNSRDEVRQRHSWTYFVIIETSQMLVGQIVLGPKRLQ